MTEIAHPPETLEGWYALHQVVRIRGASSGPAAVYRDVARALGAAVSALDTSVGGWSAIVELVGGPGDFLLMHFRPTMDELASLREKLRGASVYSEVEEIFSLLSVAEAGLYHITAELARSAQARGGKVGDDVYRLELEKKKAAELSSEHVMRRLYPEIPADMPYVCFYPMSKRRVEGQNWYELSLDERSTLMRSHGETGRRYAGRIQQVITGGIGFSEWEWGVTLFAKDPLDFKKLVTEMRFDEVSAKYAEFGPFYVGKLAR